jgi:Na+-translocating ferredoxin:NAD+ oxidoreductase subunit E
MADKKKDKEEEEKIELVPQGFKNMLARIAAVFKDYFKEFSKGVFRLNPTFVIVLGLCPTLAITTSLDNGIGMGIAAIFVLICSEILVSSIKKIVPSNVRIPVFIVVIATFVTIVALLIKAYVPALDKSLGIYIPLIVVNCIILERAESFSSKNSVFRSILDAFGVGLGFTLAIMLIGTIREIIGTGKLMLFGKVLLNLTGFYQPMLIFILAPGALMTMGLLLAFFNWFGSIDLKKQSANIDSHNPDKLTEKKDDDKAADAKPAV